MGLFDNLKNRQKIKEETIKAQQTTSSMHDACNALIYEYNNSNQSQSNIKPMIRTIDGQHYLFGISKNNPSDKPHTTNYEFVLFYAQENQQTTSVYYRLSSVGSFNKSDRGMGTITIDYLSNVDGKEVPCSATLQTSTYDLTNIMYAIQQLQQTPTVIQPNQITPAISSYNPEDCQPRADEILTILERFYVQENIFSAFKQRRETTASFMPGTGRDF